MSLDPITLISLASTLVGTAGAVGQANYSRQVARNNAAVAEQNAIAATQKAQKDAQEQDIQARAELGQLLARTGAQGLDVNSGSVIGQRLSLTELANKDRNRIRTAGDVSAANFRQMGQDFSAEAGMAGSAKAFSLLTGGIDVGKSLISNATLVNKRKASTIRRNS